MADALVILGIITIVFIVGGTAVYRAATRNPGQAARLKKTRKDRAELAALVLYLYRMTKRDRAADSVADWVAGEIEQRYGAELAEGRLQEMAIPQDEPNYF